MRPRIGASVEHAPPSQLVTLWALLFALSNFARYWPEIWVRALDPDESKVAVTLEHGLEVALAKVPRLLEGALGGGPWLARRVRERVGEREADPDAQPAEDGESPERPAGAS